MERKTIGFSPREVEEIEQLVGDAEAAPLLRSALLGGLSGTMLGLAFGDEEVSSFSEAVRRLALVGLVQVQQAKRAQQYRLTRDVISNAFDDKSVIAMGGSAMRALVAGAPASSESV
jgi:membrane protease subunit (stomatin/prohibitin family)